MATVVACPVCGAGNPGDARFCTTCGASQDRSNTSAAFEIAVAPPPPAASPMIVKVAAPRRSSGTSKSPFRIHDDKRELTIPLKRSFRFIHEPVGFDDTKQFVGRQNEMESLAERILFSDGGSFLVTGYRGVGKTSFVNRVIRMLDDARPDARAILGSDLEILDIHLNLARPVQPSEIMHHIIRRLYDRLVERDIFPRLDEGLRETLTLAYQRTSMNMARKLAEATERNVGISEASVGGELLKAVAKFTWSSKRTRSTNHEMTFLGYDDKAAEHDILTIARQLRRGYTPPLSRWSRIVRTLRRKAPPRVLLKIVFVFDELDKLEEFTAKAANGEETKPVIDHILGALKNLFTSSGVSFIFVAGKDLQERWLEDVGRGDSVYESVFAYDKYLPCLWSDVETICDGLVDETVSLDPFRAQVLDAFKKYLAYRGRGIPRRIIRTFNEYVEWHRDHPSLAFTSQDVRRIRFFAGLQEVMDRHRVTLFGTPHEEIAGTQSDKRRLGVHYLIDWILRQGQSEFTLKDVLDASARLSTKIALAQQIATRVVEDIVGILLEEDYIQAAQENAAQVIGVAPEEVQKRYRVTPRRLVEMGGEETLAPFAPDIPSIGDVLDLQKRPPSRLGKYQIVREVGSGGMGLVYQARDQQNGRQVALKVLSDALRTDAASRERFQREAVILGSLDHPNIVRLYEYGDGDEGIYLAMEYLEGLGLEEAVSRQGRLPPAVALSIARDIAKAIAYVHERGFVRNDIKPDNIVLTTTGRVCLIDFGISRPKEEASDERVRPLTVTGAIIGTPHFMAPEQAGGGRVDERSDVYALGVVLYRMLTGSYPFEGPNIYAILRAQVEDRPLPPSQAAQVPPFLDDLVMRCLEKSAEDRYESMNALATRIESELQSFQPVDLAKVVQELTETVKEIDALDQMRTMESEPVVGESSVVLPAPAQAMAAPAAKSAGSAWAWRGGRASAPIAAPPPPPVSAPPALAGPAVFSPSPAGSPARRPREPQRRSYSAADLRGVARPLIALIEGDAGKLVARHEGSHAVISIGRSLSIGRVSANDLVIRDASISRYHAAIYPEGNEWYVEDANSNAGTSVNGERLFARRALRDGDEIEIGEFVFVFSTDEGDIA